MLRFRLPAAFQHVEEADEVRIRIGVRLEQRMAHAGLRGQMNDMREAMRGEQCGKALAVRDIALLEAKPG